MTKLCVIILNYRRAALTIDCLRSLETALAGHDGRSAIVIDNNSGDGSADELEAAIDREGWSAWATLHRSPVNGGFAAGNNIGFKSVAAEFYLLLNSDARVMPDTIDLLLDTARRNPSTGLIGPRLEGPEGKAQVSCFRFRTPLSEMLRAASTGVLDRLLPSGVVAMGVFDEPVSPPWVSFACVLVRREVVEQVGSMDEGYFMYFEDIDYARRTHRAGWIVLHEPSARAVHLRGGTSSVKAAISSRERVPRYYYEARSRYFAKFYGGIVGILLTNAMWLLGRLIALLREVLATKRPHVCASEGADNWTNWLQPMRRPTLPDGGEL